MGLFGKSKGSDPKEQVNIGYTSMCLTQTVARWMNGAKNSAKKRGDLRDRWDEHSVKWHQRCLGLHKLKTNHAIQLNTSCQSVLGYMIICGLLWQVTAIRREEAKVTRSLKEAAKKGDKDVCKILARWEWTTSQTIINYLCREVVNSRKAVNKIYAAKANLNSVQMQMKTQLAQVTFLSISPYFIRSHLEE